MRMQNLPRARHPFGRGSYLWQVCVLLIVLGISTAAVLAYRATSTKAQSPWNTFHDPIYGFSFQYPNTWIATTGSNGSHITLLNPATQTALSLIVTTQSATPATILKQAVPARAVGVQQFTVAGHQAIDFTLPYVAVPKKHLLDASAPTPQQIRQVVMPIANASGTTNVYTFLLVQPTDATGKISSIEQTESATFKTIISSFTLPAKVNSALQVANASTPVCDSVCWADANWSYNYYDDSSGPYSFYCDANAYNFGYSTTANTCVDANIYAAQAPGSGVYYQPNFQCADFVARALTQIGLVPGLSNGGVSGSANPSSWTKYQSYIAKNGQTYNLIYTASQSSSDTIKGLREYLLDNGLGADVGTDTSQLQRGDVIFPPGASGFRGHVMIATSNPFQVNGTWEIEADGHNRADYHMILTPGGAGWDLIHLQNTPQLTIPSIYQLHNDGSIWLYTAPPMTGWRELDNNPKTIKLAADISGHLYQLHKDGSIWKYTGTPMTGWQELDNNPLATSIAADGNGDLYQLHKDGSIWEYMGTSLRGWQELDNNPKTIKLAADSNGNLYQLHNDGSIWIHIGPSATGWQQLDNNPLATSIVANGNGALFQLRSDGSIWKYTGTPMTGWQELDNNPLATSITADINGTLYQLHKDGSIWVYIGTPLTGWQELDNNSLTTSIAADGNGRLYQLHRDGSIWVYIGTPMTGWQQLDNNPRATAIFGVD